MSDPIPGPSGIDGGDGNGDDPLANVDHSSDSFVDTDTSEEGFLPLEDMILMDQIPPMLAVAEIDDVHEEGSGSQNISNYNSEYEGFHGDLFDHGDGPDQNHDDSSEGSSQNIAFENGELADMLTVMLSAINLPSQDVDAELQNAVMMMAREDAPSVIEPRRSRRRLKKNRSEQKGRYPIIDRGGRRQARPNWLECCRSLRRRTKSPVSVISESTSSDT